MEFCREEARDRQQTAVCETPRSTSSEFARSILRDLPPVYERSNDQAEAERGAGEEARRAAGPSEAGYRQASRESEEASGKRSSEESAAQPN